MIALRRPGSAGVVVIVAGATPASAGFYEFLIGYTHYENVGNSSGRLEGFGMTLSLDVGAGDIRPPPHPNTPRPMKPRPGQPDHGKWAGNQLSGAVDAIDIGG
jgi:hypothetical protein